MIHKRSRLIHWNAFQAGKWYGSRLHWLIEARTGPRELRDFNITQAKLAHREYCLYLRQLAVMT
jgi:hypothetical protein